MDYARLFRSMVFAAAASALLVPATRADAARHIVANGETFAIPHAYTYYRFALRQLSGGRTGNPETEPEQPKTWITLSEIALYDANGDRINQNLTPCPATTATTDMAPGSVKREQHGGFSPSTDSVGYLFDGNSTTQVGTWLNPSPDDESSWGLVCMRLANGAAPVAGYALANDWHNELACRLVAWTLEGSDDALTWATLDKVSVEESAALMPGASEYWYNGGASIPVAADASHFYVERGGTISVAADCAVGSIHSYGGSVAIAQGSTLVRDIGAGVANRFIGGGLAGAGTFEKTGGGTLSVSGINSGFAGKVKASGGTLAFRPLHVAPKYTYYRFVAKERDMNSGYLRIPELALYDSNGNRLDLGIKAAGADAKSTTNLLSGTVAAYGTSGPYYDPQTMFDGKLSTDLHGWTTKGNTESSWVHAVFRLPASSDVAPVAYNVAQYGTTDNVKSWALQGSDDHTTWFTIDEKNAAEVSAIAPEAYPGWCNGGTPLPLVHEGFNGPIGDVDAKYFRFTIKEIGDITDSTRCIDELALYDAQGKRLNLGLENKGRKYAGALTAGSFTFSTQWNPTYSASDTHEEKMFDGDNKTMWSAHTLGYKPHPDTNDTWISFTMRLSDDAAPVASYNFMPHYGSDTGSAMDVGRAPHNWLVEASKDGTTWFELDARSGEEAAELLPSKAKTYCNGGHPIGFTAGLDRWLCPTGAVVEVANGAMLELPASAPNTVSGLAADLTAASPLGTIANFNPAAAGTLYLTTATAHPMLENYALPITFTGLANAANVENWNVVVNGVAAEADEYSLRFDENDVLRVTRRRGPTVILMR